MASEPDLADARPLVRTHHPLLRGKNGKALIKLRESENGDIDPLKVRSIKNSKSLLECPTITELIATFDAKIRNDTELLKSYLAGGKKIIKFLQATKNVKVNYLTKQVAYVFFISFTLVFSYLWSKYKHAAHTCDGIKMVKHKVRTTSRLTTAVKISRTRAKPTQMFATARFTIHVFVTFSDCEESNATKPLRKRL